MGWMNPNMSQRSFATKVSLSGCAILALVFVVAFFCFGYGEPVHDINVWKLESSFYAKELPHPSDSVLLEKKRYLGGPSFHGDNRCVYAVGEMRASALSKEEIKGVYKDATVRYWGRTVPLKIIFSDEMEEDAVLPFVDWQDDLRALSYSGKTPHVVYVTVQRRILFSDYRCDD